MYKDLVPTENFWCRILQYLNALVDRTQQKEAKNQYQIHQKLLFYPWVIFLAAKLMENQEKVFEYKGIDQDSGRFGLGIPSNSASSTCSTIVFGLQLFNKIAYGFIIDCHPSCVISIKYQEKWTLISLSIDQKFQDEKCIMACLLKIKCS